MKSIFYLIAILFSFNISAQEEIENRNVFVRLFDLQGNIIDRGYILSISDTSIQLKRKKESNEIASNSIGLIKVGRSGGHKVFIGTMVGAILVGILIASVNANNQEIQYPFGEAAAAGAVVGGVLGAAFGALSIPSKEKSRFFIINGDDLKWKELKENLIL